MEGLVEVCEPSEVRIEFSLNCKCRATVRLKSLSLTTPVAFKIQTSSPNKFLVNPPSGLIPPLSVATFQVILKPQSNLPRSYPRSPSDRFLIKTAEFVADSSSINAWFASRPYGFSTCDLKLKVAFVGPLLLHDAVTRGDLDAVRNLIKRQRSLLPDFSPTQADSLLRVATRLANPDDMVHLLLEAGLRIHDPLHSNNLSGPHQVHVADPNINIAGDHKEVVEIEEQEEAILEASRRGDVKQLEWLLRSGGRDKFCDHYGLTALHAAAVKGHKDVVLMLSEAGLDLECQDEEGHVPLHMAVEGGDIGTVQVFVDKGVNLNATNKRGATPLYMARVWGYDDICQLLVSRGALSSLPATFT
ncbi:serine/threonine-protein phosphatase 6 regulatory ankyrin repeat subunit B-like [Abrus precatorius]|uniref:Serine/threonine-protein phosphatase 6 regulatory ankyrin repeat subunit B-like n=1 Tax=Abrus precatorius TaxID=3816 RepID=A0A8B8JNA8_ABRPR|nr:serine/threonine-protein phosphatase 6 regulatory ankyrin repeat subunit B-like [Abrus precatorius]